MSRHRTIDSVDLKCFWKWLYHSKKKKLNYSFICVQDLKTTFGNNTFSSVPSPGYLRDEFGPKAGFWLHI